MRLRPGLLRARGVLLGLAMTLALTDASAEGGTILPTYVNDPGVSILPGATPVFTARLRVPRNTGDVDQILFKQPNVADGRGANLGGLTAGTATAGSIEYRFRLEHDVSREGFVFTLTRLGTSGIGSGFTTTTSTLYWDNTASTPNVTSTGAGSAAGLQYNLLHLFATTNTPGSTVSYRNVSFTSTPTPGGDALQLLGPGLAAGSVSGPTGSTYAPVSSDQWIAANGDLNSFNWDVTGDIAVEFTTFRPNSGEGVKFEFSGKQGAFVPEPSSIASLGLGALALGLFAARRRRTAAPTGA